MRTRFARVFCACGGWRRAGVLLGVLVGLQSSPVVAQTGAVQLVVQEPWHTAFAGRDVVLHAVVTAATAREVRVSWRLSADGRTLQRGESALGVTAGVPAVVPIALRLPALNAGVSRALDLDVSVAGGGTPLAEAKCRHALQVFAEQAFAERVSWLRDIKLRVFDPEARTAALLTAAEVPFASVSSVDALATLEDGTLLIGEGVSFEDYRGLWAQLVARAAAGVRVLVLAPSAGNAALPGAAGSELASPCAVAWRRADIILELDKRLDATGWAPDGVLPAHGLALEAERGGVNVVVRAGAADWTWLDMRFAPAGRLIVCGFKVIEAWEASPTPRYLLLRLLEAVQEPDHEKRGEHDEYKDER